MGDVTTRNDEALAFINLDVADLKRIIAVLQNDIKIKDARLKGVQALTKICTDQKEKAKWWETKAKNYEMGLRRSEARVAQLNKMLGIGPQAAFNRGVVFPGVSRKDFDLVTQENLKLKKAMEHIVATNLGGHEVITKNQELYDLVATMREDLSQRENHIKELESALKSLEQGGHSSVPEMTKRIMKLERALNAKQVFCETLIKENEKLKKVIEEGGTLDNQELSRDVPDGGRKPERRSLEDPVVVEKMELLNGEIKVLQRNLDEKAKAFSESEKKVQMIQLQSENARRRISELEAALKEKEQEYQRKVDLEKEQLSKKCTDLQKKCDGFFKQVVSLNTKQQESEAEIERIKQALHHQADELDEKKALINLMTESLKSYEDDFRRENEEKAKCQKMFDKAQQDAERAKRENQSHMATIRHLEDEFERMNRLLNEERKRGNESKNNAGSFFALHNPALPAAGTTRSLFPLGNRPMQVVADGVDESDGTRQPDPYSMPTTKEENSSAPSLIECPYCSCSFPYREIETHVQDCMENSLYMDDKD